MAGAAGRDALRWHDLGALRAAPRLGRLHSTTLKIQLRRTATCDMPSAMPLLALALATAAALGHATSDFPAPVYTIDLDLPPEQRWHEAVTGQITKHGWEYSFKPVLDYIDTVVPPTLWSEHEMALRKIAEPIIGDEATAELRGIQSAAVALGHNISLAELEFFQVFCASSTHAPAAPLPPRTSI